MSAPGGTGLVGDSVAFVGPGRMGEPMVERLVAAGYCVNTSTRRADVRERLTAVGANVFDTAAEAAEGMSSCIACVYSEEQLKAVCLAGGVLDALSPGALVIDHVTGSLSGVRELAGYARQRGVELIDAPVSGTSTDIRAGRLAVMLGGGESGVASAAVLVSAYADWVVRTGDVGSATELKLLNNAMFSAQAQLAMSVLRLATERQFDPRLTLDVLTRCSGTSGALTYLRDHDLVDMDAALEYLIKDVAALRADARENGLDLAEIEQTIAAGPLRIIASA